MTNAAAGGAFSFILLLFGLFAFVIYFLPTIVATQRGKTNTAAILLVNLFFGWSIIGWIIALVWAVSVQVVDSQQTIPTLVTVAPAKSSPPPAEPRLCSACGKYSHPTARFCASCGLSFAETKVLKASKRFRMLTEADARMLDDGAVVALEPGGSVSKRAEEVLAQKHVTVLRSDAAVS